MTEHKWSIMPRKIKIVSFSSQIFNERSVHEIGLTATSGVILTWMQQIVKEEPENIFPYLTDIYKSKYALVTQ